MACWRVQLVSLLAVLGFLIVAAHPASGQQTTATSAAVPPLVNFSGTLSDLNGKPLTGIVGVTFLLYKEQQGGAPLWLETQNVQSDETGHYAVTLGSTRSDGLPTDIFVAGEAHWLGIQVQGQSEQPRVLLVAVPYALKAGDAQTIGGWPPSAFVRATTPANAETTASGSAPVSPRTATATVQPPATGNTPVTTAGGTSGRIPVWDSTSDITSSVMSQSTIGSGSQISVSGTLALPNNGTATSTSGKKSRPLTLTASAFNSTTAAAVNQVFQWQSEPSGNNTASPSGTLNLLFGSGSTTPSETGLRVSSKGVFTFASGQTFPGTGTVTSVGLSAPTSDFTVTGSPVTGSGMLGLNWVVAPTNADTASAIVKRDSTGSFAATSIAASSITVSNSATNGTAITVDGTGSGSYGVYSSGATYGLYGYGSTSGNSTGVAGNGSSVGVYGYSSSTTGSGNIRSKYRL